MLVFISLTLFSGLPLADCGTGDPLTPVERAWLNQYNGKIIVNNEAGWPPIIDTDKNGNSFGIAMDYQRLIEKKLNFKFRLDKPDTWANFMERFQKKEIDVNNNLQKNPKREEYALFTKPYIEIPNAIIVRKEIKTAFTLEKMTGMKIAVTKDFAIYDYIKANYNYLQVIPFDSDINCLVDTSSKNVDAAVVNLAVASYLIEKMGIANLRVAGYTEYKNSLCFASRKDWPILNQILNKGLDLITPEEKDEIYRKWISLEDMPFYKTRNFRVVCISLTAFVSAIFLITLFWNRSLKKLVEERTKTLEKQTDDLKKEISGREQAEKALSQSEAYLQTLIHTIPDLVWLKDEHGIYLFCNSRFERFFGAKKKDIIGKTDYDFVDRELADFFREHDKLAMARGCPSINEEKVTYADDGHHEILETIKTPLFGNDGKLIGVLGVARDITERKNTEEQRKKLENQLRQSHKMEAIGTISGGIAHDFNNILGIIIGNTELALDNTEEWNPNRLNLEEIKKAALRASDIVRQLLNFSRKTEQIKKTIHIHPIIHDSIKLLRSSIPTSIDIQLNLPDSVRAIVADPTQIHQVLINLCTNAAHAMEKDGGILKIDLSEVELDTIAVKQFQEINAGHYVQLAISDTGHGIDPATKAKIFDPYFTTKAVGKGTGMGLAVVLGIVKNHNGAISVYSEPGRGSTFKVLFPVAEGQTINEESISKDLPNGNETILIIDDEKGLAEIGSNLLSRLGYKVEAKTDPREALALIQADPSRFDLIITDMTMPYISGDRLIREVLTVNPQMPVILCTGFSNKIDRESALMIGAKDYIEKPLDKKQLACSVRTVLDNAALSKTPSATNTPSL